MWRCWRRSAGCRWPSPTQLNISFLRKPPPGDLFAEANLLKLGRRLAVGEIGLRGEGAEALVAHATSTYSIPSRNDPASGII